MLSLRDASLHFVSCAASAVTSPFQISPVTSLILTRLDYTATTSCSDSRMSSFLACNPSRMLLLVWSSIFVGLPTSPTPYMICLHWLQVPERIAGVLFAARDIAAVPYDLHPDVGDHGTLQPAPRSDWLLFVADSPARATALFWFRAPLSGTNFQRTTRQRF
jgi:hypothetical protein